MKKILVVVGMTAVLAAGVTFTELTKNGGAAVVTAEAQAIRAKKQRAARIPGECPAVEQGKCPGGSFQQSGWCLCFVDHDNPELIDEVTETDPGKGIRLVVCKETADLGAGIKERFTTKYESNAGSVAKDCILAADNLVAYGVSMNSIETDMTTKLRTACAPCPITAGSWGPCPRCLHPSTPSCAAACPVVAEVP